MSDEKVLCDKSSTECPQEKPIAEIKKSVDKIELALVGDSLSDKKGFLEIVKDNLKTLTDDIHSKEPPGINEKLKTFDIRITKLEDKSKVASTVVYLLKPILWLIVGALITGFLSNVGKGYYAKIQEPAPITKDIAK